MYRHRQIRYFCEWKTVLCLRCSSIAIYCWMSLLMLLLLLFWFFFFFLCWIKKNTDDAFCVVFWFRYRKRTIWSSNQQTTKSSKHGSLVCRRLMAATTPIEIGVGPDQQVNAFRQCVHFTSFFRIWSTRLTHVHKNLLNRLNFPIIHRFKTMATLEIAS